LHSQFVYLFLATSTSVIAYPLQRRGDPTQFFASLGKLNTDVTNFNNHVPDDGDILDLLLLEPILQLIGLDYQDCSDALNLAGPLSDSDAQKFVDEYIPISNSFSNGLNKMATAQKNAPNRNGGVLGALGTFVGQVGNSVNQFLHTVGGGRGNVPAQQANELNPSNSELQQALQNAGSA
ncbi:hypothetical protein F5887DRAFT_951558, partial [Amanita rubescens]